MATVTEDDDFIRAPAATPRKRRKQSCCARVGTNCCHMLKKIFQHMFPSRIKRAYTVQGQQLRSMAGLCCAMHCLFFVVSLGCIGFIQMLVNMWLAIWTYSIVLTLREWTSVAYFFWLLLAITGTFYQLFYDRSHSSPQLCGLIVNASLYILGFYYFCKAYCFFRQSGGLRGIRSYPLPEE